MYRSLNYYTEFAERLIYAYIKRFDQKFEVSDEMIGYVTNRLIKADANYRLDKVNEKRRSGRTDDDCRKYFLRMHGIYGIRAYLHHAKNNKKKHILSTDIDSRIEANFLANLYVSNSQSMPESQLTDTETNKEKERMINVLLHSSNLTPKQRHAVESHIFHKKTFEQIAAESNPPVSSQAVHVAYHAALNKMRAMVKNAV